VTARRRGAGASGKIVVVIGTPLPQGVAPSAATIEPESSSTTLTVAVRADAPPTTTLRVVATSNGLVRTKDVALTLRGPACALDRGFGEGTGVVRPARFVSVDRAIGLGAAGNAIAVGLGYPLFRLLLLDRSGALQWTRDLLPTVTGFTVEESGRVVVTLPATAERILADGGADPAFGDGGEALVGNGCLPLPSAPGATETILICGDGKGPEWTRVTLDPDGLPIATGTASFDGKSAALINQVVRSSRGVTACGGVTNAPLTLAAFMRWLPSGALDPSFGDGGVVVLGDHTESLGCVADDAGTVAVRYVGRELSLFGLGASGALDVSFGDAGDLALESDGGASLDRPAVLTDQGALLAAASSSEGVHIRRFLRDGRVDTTFGVDGACVLPDFAGHELGGVILTSDHKLLVLGTLGDEPLLARIWL
jgi:hypothetical protein